jgi:hypothetical protein
MTTLTHQRQRIAELKAALEDIEKGDPELEAVVGPELSDAEVEAFFEANRAEIEASIQAGETALGRGEYRALTRENSAAFIRELIDRGNRRRAGQA